MTRTKAERGRVAVWCLLGHISLWSSLGVTWPDDLLFRGLFQLYGYDLESEFKQFQDWLKSFPLYKGRANAEDFDDDEEERVMGKYKVSCTVMVVGLSQNIFGAMLSHASFFFFFHRQGSFLVYPIDEDDTDDKTFQITKGIPTNSAIKALVRVYIVKVSNLYTVQMVVPV